MLPVNQDLHFFDYIPINIEIRITIRHDNLGDILCQVKWFPQNWDFSARGPSAIFSGLEAGNIQQGPIL
jgi:hypothetical protein